MNDAQKSIRVYSSSRHSSTVPYYGDPPRADSNNFVNEPQRVRALVGTIRATNAKPDVGLPYALARNAAVKAWRNDNQMPPISVWGESGRGPHARASGGSGRSCCCCCSVLSPEMSMQQLNNGKFGIVTLQPWCLPLNLWNR